MKEINDKLEKWVQNPFVTLCRKVTWSSLKNEVALSTRWATLSWSNRDKPRRLFSVLLAWSTYQRMRCLDSTQSRNDGPNQNSICSVENSLLPCLCHFKRKEKVDTTATRSSKTMDAKREVLKRGKYTSTLDRWQNDDENRASQLVHGWADEWVK